MRAREGDLVEVNRAIFDVKGVVHPPGRVIASIHFLPDPGGDRSKEGVSYRKIEGLQERERLLKERFREFLTFDPVLGRRLCEIPTSRVERHYQPVARLRELRRKGGGDGVERDALSLAEVLKEQAGIPWRKIGISGSVLVGLHSPASDLDPIVYGSADCKRVYQALQSMFEDERSPFKPLGPKELRRLHRFRSRETPVPFKEFTRVESRKVLQGRFLGRMYSMRLVKDWGEVERYGLALYTPLGRAEVEAEVVDSSEAIFTPCRYGVKGVEVIEGEAEAVEEVASFRPRFCEQVEEGERIIARGRVEEVFDGRRSYFRLMVGSEPSDLLFPII